MVSDDGKGRTTGKPRRTMSSHPSIRIFVLLVLLWVLGSSTVRAQESFIYWVGAVSTGETGGTTIFRTSLDNTGIDTLLSASEPSTFNSVAIDTVHGKIYWTESSDPQNPGAIGRAALNGDSAEVLLEGIACGIGTLTDLELDLVEDKMYWGENSDCGVGLLRAGLDGADVEEFPLRGNFYAGAIALDIVNRMIYWTYTQPPVRIMRASLSGENLEVIIDGPACGLALARSHSKIYWTDCTGGKIRRANSDGREAEDVLVTRGDPTDLAIDEGGKKIYWTERNSGKIRRANLDGTDAEDLLTGLVKPGSLALSFGSSTASGIDSAEAFPEEYRLHQNYPNPFNQITTIKFDLPRQAHVTLEVYDIMGRKIAVLASENYPAGSFNVPWNMSGLANGMYLCRMKTESYSETIKLVLQR